MLALKTPKLFRGSPRAKLDLQGQVLHEPVEHPLGPVVLATAMLLEMTWV